MVRIRLQRIGRRNRACFRIVVTDARVKRQGQCLEKVGFYDPVEKDAVKQLVVDGERVRYWLAHGAQLSEPVANLLHKRGLAVTAKPAKPHAAEPAPASR